MGEEDDGLVGRSVEFEMQGAAAGAGDGAGVGAARGLRFILAARVEGQHDLAAQCRPGEHGDARDQPARRHQAAHEPGPQDVDAAAEQGDGGDAGQGAQQEWQRQHVHGGLLLFSETRT
jgi:hypothetical protein